MSRLLPLHDVTAQPWRNGGGRTRELLAWPSPSDWQVRVSVADIDVDGPFSPYPGVDRWFTVLQGKGVDLAIDGRSTHLVRGDPPFRFDGAAEAHASLVDGPTRDLNLMLRGASGSIQCAADGLPWSPKATQCGLFSAVDGLCESEGQDGIEVPAYALLWFDTAPTALRFTAVQRPAALIGWWLAATPRRG
jgi:environmental stress-induced protein Ves